MLLQVLFEGLVMGLIYALLSMGIAMIWGVCGILSFSQGEFMMISMYLTYFLYTAFGIDPALSIPLVMIIMFFAGVLTYRTIITKALKAPVLSQRLVTFALGMVLTNGMVMLVGSRTKTIDHFLFEGSINLGLINVSKQKLVPMIVAIIVTVALFLFLNRTKIGRSIRATAQNKTAAGLMGINTARAHSIAFGISTAIAGAAGASLTYYYFITPTVGAGFLIFGFMAVCIGGIGSIAGAAAGGLLIGFADLLSGTYLSVSYKYVAVILVFLLVVSLKPKGLFGGK